MGYRSKLEDKDQAVIGVMQRLASQYPRYGYRRIHVFLAREGHRMSLEKCHRIWRKAGLQVPRKSRRRRAAASRPRPLPSTMMNHVWAYDFIFDGCANG